MVQLSNDTLVKPTSKLRIYTTQQILSEVAEPPPRLLNGEVMRIPQFDYASLTVRPGHSPPPPAPIPAYQNYYQMPQSARGNFASSTFGPYGGTFRSQPQTPIRQMSSL